MKKAKNHDEAWSMQNTYSDQSHGWIQWKGTDVCIDLHCDCGHHGHVDAAFFYHYKCGGCGQYYEVNSHIRLDKIQPVDGAVEDTV